MAGDPGHLAVITGRDRLLEPQGIERLEALCTADCAGRRRLAVCLDHQVTPIAGYFLHSAGHRLGGIQLPEGELSRIK